MNKSIAKASSRESRGWLDPFDSLYEDMDRFFSNQLKRLPHIGFRGDGDGRLFANLDIGETGDEIVVELDAPGVKREDIDITLSDHSLRVRGRRESHKEEKGKSFHRVERDYGEFERRVVLPCEVDAEKVDAALSNGVLTIKLPKSARAREKERKIEVHT